MKGKVLSLGAAALLAGGAFLLSGQTNSANAQDLLGVSFIDNVKPYLEFRPRYEYVDVDNSPNKEANALTIRTKVGVKIGTVLGVQGLSAVLEAIDVSALVDDYAPQKAGYEKVADPDNTRLTQAYIAYSLGNYTFVAGRKYVAIDDHRFIGTVGWRQMPQTFGVLAVAGKPIQGLNFLLAGIYERKGIVDSLNADWDLDKMPIILDVNYKVIPQLKIKGFAYLITDVHNTYGIKASGKVDLGGIKVSYLGEYAKQTDPYENDNKDKKPDVDTDYYRLKVGASAMGFFANVMYTHFGDGDINKREPGFSTPLATLHKFDGWADVLLTGAAKGFYYGMNEWCISAGYKNPTLGKFMIAYLTFDSDKDPGTIGKDIGSEIDILYTKKLTKRLSFLAKAAWYDADNGYITVDGDDDDNNPDNLGKKDVTKYWLQLVYKY